MEQDFGRKEFKIGEWYMFSDGSLICITSQLTQDNKFNGYGWTAGGEKVGRDVEYWSLTDSDTWRQATKQEILGMVETLF